MVVGLDWTTCGLGVLFGVFTIIAYGAYNIWFHPCRKFPGPKLWAAYRLPFAITIFKGSLPHRVLELHRKYGPVVRIAPNELSFTDERAWNDIQGILPDRRQNPKEPLSYGPLGPGAERQIIFAGDEQHARLRRIFGPAFTPKAVEEQGGMLLKYADQLVATLKENIKRNPVQDMSKLYNATTFDLTGEFAFDESFHCLEKGGASHFFMEIVLKGTIAGLFICQLERYGIWQVLQRLLPKSFFKEKYQLDDYAAALVDRRRERGFVPGKTDVFNYLLQSKHEQDRLSREELIDNTTVLVVAGSETTATLLSGASWLLCKNKDIYAKVKQEVRSAYSTDDDITPKSVNNLPYMIAVLSEAMRLFPPTGFGFPRIIGANEGQSIAGYHVPSDTRCSVFHYAAYHYEQNFTRPDEFLPERWLDTVSPEFANDHRDVLQPFHVGPRGCLGKTLAYAEMRLLFAKMLWHFDMELATADDNWGANLKAYSVWQRTSLNIRLKVIDR